MGLSGLAVHSGSNRGGPRNPRGPWANSGASHPAPGIGSGAVCLVTRGLVGGEGKAASELLEMFPSAPFLKASLDTPLVLSFEAGVLLPASCSYPQPFQDVCPMLSASLRSPLLSHATPPLKGLGGDPRCSPTCPSFVGQPFPTFGGFRGSWQRSFLERSGLPDTLTGDRFGAAASAVYSKWCFSP